jgi:hypothetical protein
MIREEEPSGNIGRYPIKLKFPTSNSLIYNTAHPDSGEKLIIKAIRKSNQHSDYHTEVDFMKSIPHPHMLKINPPILYWRRFI